VGNELLRVNHIHAVNDEPPVEVVAASIGLAAGFL
jgi:hypothetical protein